MTEPDVLSQLYHCDCVPADSQISIDSYIHDDPLFEEETAS